MLLRGPGTRSERPRLQLGLSELSDPPCNCACSPLLHGWHSAGLVEVGVSLLCPHGCHQDVARPVVLSAG